MAEKIEGYRERDSKYETLKPKETTKEMKVSSPVQGPSMSKTIEEHMSEINKGRGNGVPDNAKKKAN